MQHILHIEDNPGDAKLVQAYLSNADVKITQISHLSQLKDLPKSNIFNIILLDLSLPDSQKLNTLRTVKNYFPQLPIVIMSGLDDEPLSIAAVQAGAQDYIVKNQINSTNLKRIISHAIERNRLMVALNALQQHQQYLATHDDLTSLPNRQLLHDRLSQVFAQCKRHNTLFAILFIDLDNFKQINDTYGHSVGDRVLKTAADRMRLCLRDFDTIARIGGDEFTVVLTELNHADDAASVAKHIAKQLKQPMFLDERSMTTHASIGIAVYPDDGKTVDELLQNADSAMYQAKQSRQGYHFFKRRENTQSYRELSLATDLAKALDHNQFILHFQPQIDTKTEKPIAVEALIRWQHPRFGFLSPSMFLNLAEETGLIVPIGEWVLYQAAKQLKRWQQHGIPPVTMAVNVSSQQFLESRATHRFNELLAQSEIKPDLIDLELTESSMMQNPQEVAHVVANLREQGFSVTIDDFGTGYSSLSYLKHFPVNALKIDKSFVDAIALDEQDANIVKAILSLANTLKLNTIAEGVENAEQQQLLADFGCHAMQGYWFKEPMEPEACERFLKDNLTGSVGVVNNSPE